MAAVKILRTIPGAAGVRAIVRDFCRRPEGVVTAFSDGLLPVLRQEVDEDCLIELLSFEELVRRVLGMAGEEVLLTAPAGHYQAAIAVAAREGDDDSPFRSAARFPGFHKACARTLHELHAWGLDADDLADLASQTAPRLRAKLEALAALDRRAGAILGSLGRSSHTAHLRACLEGFPERDGTLERVLVFAGSEEFPLRARWLNWLAESGVDVTVVTDRHAAGGQVFAGARRTEALFSSTAREIGEGNRLLRRLFGDAEGGAAIDVEIVSAADPLAEVEWALRGCGEAEPGRSAVFVRDLESYAPLIEAAARRLGLPLRIARREPLLANAFARMTLAAIEFCASDDVRTLGPIAASSYLHLGTEDRRRLIGGLRESHRMRGMQWQTLRTWAEMHEEAYPWLLALLIWRHERASAPLSAADWTGRLVELMDLLPWHESLTSAPSATQRRDVHAQSSLRRALAAYASVDRAVGASPISLARFAGLCRELWAAADVSVPQNDAGIPVVGSAEALGEVDRLFVLGMLEGVFPRRRSEDPILTDDERRAVSALRPEEPPLRTSVQTAAAERDEFYRLCGAARRSLVFSYPQSDDQRDNVPAFYLEAVAEAAGEENVRRRDFPRTRLAPEREACHRPADLRLREALGGPRELPSTVEIVSERAREALRPAADETYSPAQLRDAYQCSFQFVARHRLRLDPRRPASRWATLRSLPQAAGLLRQPSAEAAEAALRTALDDRLEALYPEAPAWELSLIRAGGLRLIEDWVGREFLARTLWPREDVTENVVFGEGLLRDTMPGGVRLSGLVPGISRLGNYRVAHLYGFGARDDRNLSETEQLYFGLFLLAMHEKDRDSALEIEGMGSHRVLMVLNRTAGRALTNRHQDGLRIIDLGNQDDPALFKKFFFEDVKRTLSRAHAFVREPSVAPRRGDHCAHCDYGELCRRATEFGEEDSPFGADAVLP